MEKNIDKLCEVVDWHQDNLDNIFHILVEHQKIMVREYDELLKLKRQYKRQNIVLACTSMAMLTVVATVALTSQLIINQEYKIRNTEKLLDSVRRKLKPSEAEKPEEK